VSVQWLFYSCFLLMLRVFQNVELCCSLQHACAFKRFLDFVLIDNKWVLNPDSLDRYVAANGMSIASTVSQSLRNITIAELQIWEKIFKFTLEKTVTQSMQWVFSQILSFSDASDTIRTQSSNFLFFDMMKGYDDNQISWKLLLSQLTSK